MIWPAGGEADHQAGAASDQGDNQGSEQEGQE